MIIRCLSVLYKISRQFTFLLYIFLVVGCKNINTKNYISFGGFIQGTTYQITYFSNENKDYRQQIDGLLVRFDSSLSTYKPYSLITRINNNDSLVEIDDYFEVVFNKAYQVYEETNGAFDITVAPVINAWGFGPEKRVEVDSAKIIGLLKFVGMQHVKIDNHKIYKKFPEVKLDVNAIAQGYSVDIIADFFDKEGIDNYLVEIGGEIRTRGVNRNGGPWRIGIDKPIDNNQVPGQELQTIVQLQNKAIATSGNYRKFFEEDGIKYAHTINPKTGFQEKHSLLSVTVLSNDCISADAYATAFMIMGLEQSIEFVNNRPDLEAYFIYSDKGGNFKVKTTKGFQKLIIK